MYLLITKGTKLTTILENKTIVLQEDIKVPVETRTVFEANNDEFGIHTSCYNLDSLQKEILISLAFDYEEYGLAEDEELCGKETIEYKYKMLNLFKEVED